MSEKVYATGLYGKQPREGAKDFVAGSVSVKSEAFIEFLQNNTNEKGYCNLDILKGTEGRLNFLLNTYVKPQQEQTESQEPRFNKHGSKPKEEFEPIDYDDSDLPF